MDATVQRLATYLDEITFENISEEGIHEARRRIIDSVACAAAASAEPFCRKIARFAARSHSTPPARIWGSGEATSIEMAAFANGTMLRYLDLSDTILAKSNGHPSDMLGGLIAVAEAFKCDGKSLLAAVVAAYEIYCSLCASVSMAGKGIDQGTAATVGSAAGVACLLTLPREQIAHALSLALVDNLHLYNVRCGQLSDWKGCGGPNGARNGVFAAMLAREGVSGPTAAVEGKGGLWDVLGRFDWQPGKTTAPLICQTHLKFYPVCYHGQSAVDAALVLRKQVNADEIIGVEIETYEAAYLAMGHDAGRWAPANRETADHSLPYTVAHAWLTGTLASSAYDADNLQNPVTLELMQRISVRAESALSADFPAHASSRIRVRTRDGRELTHLQRNPKGNAGNPLADHELDSKFIDLFSPWGDEQRAQQVSNRLWALDGVDDLSLLIDVLCPKTHSGLSREDSY